jgi:hypothetical protein
MISRMTLLILLILSGALLVGCAASSAQPSATQTKVPTATPAPATRTPTPPGPVLYTENSRTFLYFNACFDLDEGVGSVGASPDCDFSIHTDPGGSDETILFFPEGGAKFDFGERLSARPSPEACRDSRHLSGTMQAFVPQISYFMCYQTNEGRVGFFKFIDLTGTGLAVEWQTYEFFDPGDVTFTPQSTPTAPFSGIENKILPPEKCFDLDIGEVVATNAMSCDFTLTSQEDHEGGSPLLNPAYPAVFLEGESLPYTPYQSDCRALNLPDGDERLPAEAGTVLCFQTNQGRYGFLRVLKISPSGELSFEWQTFEPPVELLVKIPTAAPDPYPLHAAGLDQLVPFHSCFDLDEGIEAGQEMPACDFSIYPGPGGSFERIEFSPALPARFDFDSTYRVPPSPQQCAATGPFMSASPDTLYPLEAGYLCYQTNIGRYGFLSFAGTEDDGVTLDWNTFNPPDTLLELAPAEAPILMNDPGLPGGSPTWIENFTTDKDWSFYTDPLASFQIQEGQALLTAHSPDNQDSFRLSRFKLTDFYLEATFETGERCSGLDHYGLMARAVPLTDGEAGYLFGATCNGHYFLRKRDGKETTLLVPWTASPILLQGPGQTQRLGLLAQGERLVLFANGQPLEELKDASYSDGQFGLFIGSVSSSDFSVRVDELATWTLP